MGDFLKAELLFFLVTVSMAILWYQYRNESEKTGHAKVLKTMGVLKVLLFTFMHWSVFGFGFWKISDPDLVFLMVRSYSDYSLKNKQTSHNASLPSFVFLEPGLVTRELQPGSQHHLSNTAVVAVHELSYSGMSCEALGKYRQSQIQMGYYWGQVRYSWIFVGQVVYSPGR